MCSGAVHLGLHDRFRQRHVDLLEQGLQRGGADLLGLLHALDPADLIGQAGPQLVDGVEFACQLGEFVIGLGQLTFLDRDDGDGDFGLLAGVRTGGHLGGEDLGLAGRQADDRIVETVDKLAGADLVRQALRRRLGDIFAVDVGRQVDRDEVAGRGGPIDSGQGAEPGAQRLQFGVDILVADLDRVDGDLQRAQVGQGDVGSYVDLGGEDQFLAVLLFGDLDVGLAERPHVRIGHRLAVAAGQRLVDDLVEHRLTADPRLQQLGRRLARTETRQPHLLGELLVGPVEVGLQFLERHLYVDANPGGAQLLDGALHGCAPRLCWGLVVLQARWVWRASRGDRI